MRNLVYFKIIRKLGLVNIVENIVTQDLDSKVSWGDRSELKALSVVCESDSVRIIFDHFNSLPLFWGEAPDGAIIISNQHDKVAKEVTLSGLDTVGFWELYLFESPLLSRTLFKGVSISQSGHDLVVDQLGSRLERRFNFAYGQQEPSTNIIDDAHELLSSKLSKPFDNTLFPISGGVDSRLILSYMKDTISSNTQFLTYGFSPKILENTYAKEILQSLYGSDYSHDFHVIESHRYMSAGLRGTILTGGLAGIQNSHLLGYAQQSQLIGAPCILGMFADAIFGYGASERATDWQTCAYAKKAKHFQMKGILSDNIVEQILADLNVLYNEWRDGSDISSFDEYLYVRERNGKFHTSLMNALQSYWDVEAPLNDWDIIKFFMSLPNDVRKNKAIVKEILVKFFPEVGRIGDVSSSFRHGNASAIHKLSTLTNNILARKLGVLPIIPVYTDTERLDYSFLKYYKADYQTAIEQMKDNLKLSPQSVTSLEKLGSGMHGFQFISNAQVINSSLVSDDER